MSVVRLKAPSIKTVLTGTLLCVLVTLAGCSSTGSKKLPEYEVRRAWIIPPQVMHKELLPFSQDIQLALEQALRKHKLDVVILPANNFDMLKDKALESSGSIYNPQLGEYTPLTRAPFAKRMLELINSFEPVDILVYPQLVLRRAQMNDDRSLATFDGITRPIEFASDESGVKPLAIKGLSLKLNAYTRTGNATMGVFSGLSLPFIIDETDAEPKLLLKQTLIDDADINRGVKSVVKQWMKQIKPVR